MEAILSQHYQVENLQIYQNKGRIMNLDPTEITSPNIKNCNDLKSPTQPTFYACDICEYTSNDPNSLNAHLQAQHTEDDDIQEIIPSLTAHQDSVFALPQPMHHTL